MKLLPSPTTLPPPPRPDADASLNALGGKGGGKGVMRCFGCDGEGHPQRLCPSVPGKIRICNICHGKGHYANHCTSKWGGAYKDGAKGGEKGKGTGHGVLLLEAEARARAGRKAKAGEKAATARARACMVLMTTNGACSSARV